MARQPVVRVPVYEGSRRIPGLTIRTKLDGTPVYEIIVRVGGGKRRRIILDAQTHEEAIAEVRRDLRDRGNAADRSKTVSEYVSESLNMDKLRAAKGEMSPRTVALHRSRAELHLLPLVGSVAARELRPGQVKRLLERLEAQGLSGSSRRGVLSILRRALDRAVDDGVVRENVARITKAPSGKRSRNPRRLNPAQVEALLAKLSDAFRAPVAIMAYQGLRVSETLGLRWRDVDMSKDEEGKPIGKLTVAGQLDGKERRPTKTPSSKARIDMTERALAVLEEWQARQVLKGNRVGSNDLVFTTSRGLPQSRRNVHRALTTAATNAGLNDDIDLPSVTVHDLRGSCGSIALSAGTPLVEVSRFLRHANTKVTAELYSDVMEDTENRSARAIDEAFANGAKDA